MKKRPFKEVIYNEDGSYTLKLDGKVCTRWVRLPGGGDKSKHNRAMRRQASRLWKQKYGEKRNAKKYKPDGSLNWNCFLIYPDRIIDNRPRMRLVDFYMQEAMKKQAAWIDRVILNQYPGMAPLLETKWTPPKDLANFPLPWLKP